MVPGPRPGSLVVVTNTWPWTRGRVPEREAFGFAATVLFIVFTGDGIPNTISWIGWAVVCAGAGAWGVAIAIRARPSFRRTPNALWVYIAWCLVSVAWSHWRVATTASIAAQLLCALMAVVIASTLSWRRILDALSLAVRWVLALSLVFEAVVAVLVRHPVYPVWTHYGGRHVPAAFAFSRAELFTGGRIQGLPGNANLLAMVALLAAIAVGVQLAEGRMRRVRATGWLSVAAVVFLLTRSSTVVAAAAVTALMLAGALVIRRVPTGRRTPRYLAGLAIAVVLAGLVALLWRPVLALAGKSPDLTGRGEIWRAVWGLVEQHPVLGWGWLGYWWPAIEPLNHLAVRNGVTYLQAHDAFLDVWMQTGVVGVVLFGLAVLTTLARSWASATAFSYDADHRPRAFAPVSLLALLVVVALLVQSVTESRLLYEGDFILFVLVAVKTRIVAVGDEPPSIGDGPRVPVRSRSFRRAAAGR